MFLNERFTHKCSLIRDLSQVSRTNPFGKRSTSFSVALPRTMCAYFVCVLSVLYTVSVPILLRESFSSSAITLYHVLISQNVTHASGSKGCACVMRTWLRFATQRKKSVSGISTLAFPLECPNNNSLFGTTSVLCHQIDNKQMNCLPGLSWGWRPPKDHLT